MKKSKIGFFSSKFSNFKRIQLLFGIKLNSKDMTNRCRIKNCIEITKIQNLQKKIYMLEFEKTSFETKKKSFFTPFLNVNVNIINKLNKYCLQI